MIVVQRSTDSSLHNPTYKWYLVLNNNVAFICETICFCTDHSHSFPSTEVFQTELQCDTVCEQIKLTTTPTLTKNNVCSVCHTSQSCKEAKTVGGINLNVYKTSYW